MRRSSEENKTLKEAAKAVAVFRRRGRIASAARSNRAYKIIRLIEDSNACGKPPSATAPTSSDGRWRWWTCVTVHRSKASRIASGESRAGDVRCPLVSWTPEWARVVHAAIEPALAWCRS